MALKKFHLAPWIQWYPWTERASKPPKSMLIPKLNGYSDGTKQVPCSTTDTMVSMNWTRFQTTKNLHSYQNLTVIQMALKKLHLVPWIWWYPWTERASADLSLWAANDIHFQTTIINDEIVHDYDENWLSIYGSSSTIGSNIF